MFLNTAVWIKVMLAILIAFVVSFAQVERLDGGDVIIGGRRVPLSKHRRKQFLAALAAYWGERL